MSQQTANIKNVKKHKTWNPFRITSYDSLMQPYVFMLSICGFFPYKVVSSRYVFSIRCFIWSTIVLIAYMCFLPIVCYEIIYITKGFKDVSRLMHYYVIIIFGNLSIFAGYIMSRSKIRMYQRMIDASRTVSLQTFREISKWIFMKDILGFLPLALSVKYTFIEQSVFSYFCLYTFAIVLTFHIFYVNNLIVLKTCLGQINDSVVRLRILLISDQPHLLRRVYHTQMNPMLLKELKALRRQHLEISRIIGFCNDTFSYEIIFTVILTGLDITFNFYYFLIFDTVEGRITNFFSPSIMFMIYHSIKLIMIVGACEMVKDEVKKIGSNLHRVLTITFDEEMIAELELFSGQVLQHDNTFMAMGLPIDATVLVKIGGTVFTYVLLLVQFLLVKPC
ncbi:uncharacterized protein LOC143183460 [Calliopsis andreniformis]|uniref:uncharacterized protein LOC143183460 n=1 Tax=Calliopsis andreniformis TaxID=337506 RepID=UPI003FCCBE1F